MPGQSLIEILFKSKYDGAGTQSASNSLKEIDNAAGIAAGGIAAVGAALGIAGAVKLAGVIDDLTRVGAQAERVGNSFRQMQASIGQSAEGTLSALRKASTGAIADTQLELNANRAKVLGVAQTSGQLAQLLEAAAARGKAVGRSTAEAFDDIVTGIGRMSPLILDNLGILTGGAATFNAYAVSIGKTADQLSDAEKKQALFNKVIEDSRSLVEANKNQGEDLATTFERMDASIQNAKVALGELFGPAVAVVAQSIAAAAQAAADGVKATGNAMKENTAAGNIELMKAAIASLSADIHGYQQALETLTPGTETYKQTSDRLGQALVQLHQRQADLTKVTDEHFRVINELHPANADAAGSSDLLTVALGHMNAEMQGTAAAGPALYASLLATVPAFGIVQDMATATSNKLAQLKDEMAGLKGGLVGQLASAAADVEGFVGKANAEKLFNDTASEAKKRLDDLAVQRSQNAITDDQYKLRIAEVQNDAKAVFDDIKDQERSAASEAKKWGSAVESEVKKAYNDLRNTVAGVIQDAQKLSDIGVDPSKILRDPKETDPKKQIPLLPREDEINENARRLADIAVNGFKGQDWLGKFKAEVPDIWKALEESGDPRATAARLLQRFQDGLEPELLDKEKAKERVRKLLLGEEKTSELVDEITKELADEMGTATPSDLKSKVKEALTGQGDEKTKIEVDTSGIAPAIQTALAAPDISVSGGGSGDAAGKAFNDKMLAAVAETGNKLIDAVDGELRAPASLERLGTAGNMGGTAYGTQFLNGAINNIAQPFLDAVTGIVTSNVIAKLNTQNQLQGANP